MSTKEKVIGANRRVKLVRTWESSLVLLSLDVCACALSLSLSFSSLSVVCCVVTSYPLSYSQGSRRKKKKKKKQEAEDALKDNKEKPGVVVQTFNPSIGEAKACRYQIRVPGHPEPPRGFLCQKKEGGRKERRKEGKKEGRKGKEGRKHGT